MESAEINPRISNEESAVMKRQTLKKESAADVS
jgi:hypothetical protein